MKRNERNAVLYLLGLLLGIFNVTLLVLIQGFSKYVYIGIGLLAALQAAGLIWYLHEERKPKSRLFRFLLKMNHLTLPVTLGATVYLYLTMAAQFHAVLKPDAAGDITALDMQAVESAENCYVYKTDDLYLIFPQYSEIRFVYDECPSMSDPELTMFVTSAFFHTFELTFHHENVVGAHATGGVYYEGAAEENLSAFTFYDGEAHFTLDDPDAAVRTAAEHGGEGFEQFMAIWNGEKTWNVLGKRRCYRVLAELNGRVCVIESASIIGYADFIAAVQALGVEKAMYVDMGAHSSYSQYRNNDGKVINLFGKRGEFVHSWVAFYK